ncbi:MAG: WD40 repeat protein [Planctomycetota bacterium]|jgi:WD40 repeat protein
MKIFQIACTAIVAASVISGCSSSNNAPAPAAPSFPRVADLVAQTATITITDPTGVGAGPTVAVTSQPADITVTGSATVLVGVVTLNLKATNNSGRVISNMKAVLDAATSTLAGASVTASSGTDLAGDDFVSFDVDAVTGYVKSVDKAATATAVAMDITTVAATDLSLNFVFPTEDVLVLVGGDFGSRQHTYYTVDSGDGLPDFEHDGIAHSLNQYSAAAGFRISAPHPDGTKFFLGTRQMPQVVVHDNVTGKSTHMSIARDGRAGAIHGLTVSPDSEYLYVSLLDGEHSAPWDGGGTGARVWLIKIAIATMTEVGALELTTDAGGTARLQDLTITTDGTLGAAPLFFSGQVAVVNLADMTLNKYLDVTQVIKTTATPPISGSAGFKPRHSAISPDGAYVYVAHQYDYDSTTGLEGSLEVYDVPTGTGAAVTLTTYAASSPKGLKFGPDGRLYYLRNQANPLSIFTFTAADYSAPTAEIEVVGGTGAYAEVAFGPYGDYYYTQDNGTTVEQFDITTDTVTNTITGIGGSRYHVLSVSAY